jgi:hypothetical protein
MIPMMMMIRYPVVRSNDFYKQKETFYILEIDDGEDENIEHENDYLGKLKGKV